MARAYVGNLPFSLNQSDLAGLFAEFGTVRSAEIIIDRETGRPRGFGFVDMETPEQLAAAIAGLNGRPVGGRSLSVTEARERESRGPGGPRPSGPGGGFRPSGPRPGGPPRDFGGPRPGGAPRPNGAPRTGGPGPGAGGGRPDREPERDRGPRKGRGMDDYDRHDKSWKRGGDDWE
jgi:cold-inducible RNA-binding protein